MVFIDPAAQYNKIYAHVFDTSIEYKPLHMPSHAILAVDDVQVRIYWCLTINSKNINR